MTGTIVDRESMFFYSKRSESSAYDIVWETCESSDGDQRLVRTYVWLPPWFTDPQDIVQKETGAVLQLDTPALQEGFDGRICPEGVYIGCERFEEGSWV